MEPKFLELKTRLAEMHDLNKTAALLSWDQQTHMPPKGSAVRAEQRSTLSRLIHDKSTSDELGRLLDDLRPYEESLPYDSDEASLIRVARSDYEKARRVPTDLQAEMTRARALAMDVWVEARKKSDYALFLPHLEKIIELKHRYVECFAPFEDTYDPLLDDFERGMKTAQVKAVFDDLKHDLVPLIAAIAERADAVSEACLHGHFPAEKQRECVSGIVSRFGFNPDSWRLDPTTHPFATSMATTDIRITTRYNESFVNAALFGTLHECGHGLYENGVSPSLERTPFYRAINKVQPSFIRVEADEATYNLHIILRFELEQEMMQGKLALRGAPEAWNARMKQYLGVDVLDDARGVLQDVHWSDGLLGYFPTYSLGNIIAAQIWEKALEALPNLYEQFERGEFTALREWLRQNLHRHGRKFTPVETLERVVGGPIKVGPYVRYLQSKLGEIYGIK